MKTLFLVFALVLLPAYLFASEEDSTRSEMLSSLLKNKSCQNCDLKKVKLQGVDLEGADLRGANLAGAQINQVNFKNALLDKANLSGAIIQDTDFNNASLEEAYCSDASFFKINLKGARLNKAIFSQATLKNIDLTEITGLQVDFSEVEVFAAKFNHADLSGSSFIAARVKESDFTSATMHNMDFTDAVFFKTNLQDIDAQGTNLENIFLLSHNIQNAAKQKITVKTGGTSKKHVTLVSSYGLIVEKKRLLLCQYSNKTNIIKWTLPGGLVKFKEDPADTLRRKVKEEAGVIASVKKIAGLHSKTTRRKSAEYHGIRVLYSAEITRGKIVDQCKWWDIKKINQLELTEIAEVGQSLISQ